MWTSYSSVVLATITDAVSARRFTNIRNTQQGKQEERLPFFTFVFPPWFERTHPDAVRNFRTNAGRLTTPFDIYPTLKNVLHFEVSERTAFPSLDDLHVQFDTQTVCRVCLTLTVYAAKLSS